MAMHIPGYRVIRKINQGGMSTVYLAIQISVGRIVALKVMNPQLNNDPAFSERFQREATIVGQLSHPNIVSIYDIGRHEDLNYIAMDYLPNGSVHDKMVTGITGEDALRVTKEIANALDHAHEKGYIHRDIKPENILFRADNSAVLSDFGVAKGAAVSSRMTQVGSVVGTPHYMSPEQTKGSKVDARSDLYSLGIVLYEMLTGTLPYQGDEAVTIALKHISAPVPKLPIQYLAYQKILDKLLAKDPEQRFQRGRDVTAAIEELEKNQRANASSTPHPTDASVISLLNALFSATQHALRWRWNRLRQLRWAPDQGFYNRPGTRITAIFPINTNDQQNTAINRALRSTQVNHTFSTQSRTATTAMLTGAVALALWCTFSIWLAFAVADSTTHSASKPGIFKAMAFATADIFIDLPKTTQQSVAKNIVNSSKSSASVSSTPINNAPITTDTAVNATANPAITETTSSAMTNNVDTTNSAAIDNRSVTQATSSLANGGTNTLADETPVIPIVTYGLRINTIPNDARVRILNIPDRYRPGIQLPVGRYHIEVSKTGYDVFRAWIEISSQDVSMDISLNKIITPGTELSSELTARIRSQGPEMISIAAGSFLMGNKDDAVTMPVHNVLIPKPFAISKYEITFEDYDIFAQATKRILPDDNNWGRENRPVINVSYFDAKAYAEWLSETTGKKYRLPTEAEWEYIARAQTNTLFWWGNDARDAAGKANCRRGCSSKFSGLFGSKTAPVGTYPANRFGVYDTAGNVAEWVEDCFADNYSQHPKNGLAFQPKNCEARVVRGGSAKSDLEQIASHARDYHRPEIYNQHLGFRVVMELK